MFDRYGDITKFITEPDKLEVTHDKFVYISSEEDYDIAVNLNSCYGSFDEVKPFIAFLAKHINELDNTVQRFDCRNGSDYDPNSDETPFVLEFISLEKPDTITLSYICTDENSQFDAVFEFKDNSFHLRLFGIVKNIPDNWEENIKKT